MIVGRPLYRTVEVRFDSTVIDGLAVFLLELIKRLT